MAKHFLGDTPDGEILIEDSLDRELAELLASEDGADLSTPEGVQKVSKALLETFDEAPQGKYSSARFHIVPAHQRSKPKNWEEKPVARHLNRDPDATAGRHAATEKSRVEEPKATKTPRIEPKPQVRVEVETTPAVVDNAQPVEKVVDLRTASPTPQQPRRPAPARPYKPVFSRPLTASPRQPGEFSLDQALAGFAPQVEPGIKITPAKPSLPSPAPAPSPTKRQRKLESQELPVLLPDTTGWNLEFWLDGAQAAKAEVRHNLFEAIAYNRLARTSVGLLVAVAMTYVTSVTEMRAENIQTDQLAAQTRQLDESASRSAQTVATPVLAVAATPPTTAAPTTTTTAPPPPPPPPPPLPTFSAPVDGATRTSGFGNRTNPVTGSYRLHAGVDYAAATGTPIKAATDGTVTEAGWTSGYGNYTCISHADGLSSCYAHQSAIGVSVGQTVARGELIGKVGNTGNSTGPHLHFEARKNGTPVDPTQYF